MLSRLGDHAWLDIIRRDNALIEALTAAYGGTVVETQGDGSMLAFSSARRAVACARDAAASRMIDAGLDPVTVAGVLGHDDPSITLKVYAARFNRQSKDEAVRAALSGSAS
jgi:class 3 adenylate cyclase